MTEDPRHKLSLRGQLLDAQKSCCPCRLCGGAAVIKDAGPGFGYFIYCENSYATSNPSCLQAGVSIRAWAYACSELWNKLNKPVAPRTARPVKVKPLVWVHGAGFGKQEHSYADTELGTWCMTAYNGRGGRWAYTDPCGNDSEDDWLTRDECQTAVETAREARILAELEPQHAALALVAAAYRDAADVVKSVRAMLCADEIRAKTPADAQAALTAIERAAYERGKAEAQVQGDTFYILEWMAGAKPPVHPNPMRGRQSFRTPKEAIAFFKRQASDAQFLSLTKRVFITEDCTPQALALLTQEGR